ncbi:MAG: YicC/YloC family endoribonuclease [Paracoccaceae bacterium]
MTKENDQSKLRSMTGFANAEGSFDTWRWNAELRSVNGKGLDLRLRLPDWVEGLEQSARAIMSSRLKRGNVNLNIRVSRDDAAGQTVVNSAQLDSVLAALREIEARALSTGLDLAPSRAADIAVVRGVLEQEQAENTDTGPLKDAILKDVQALVVSLDDMRASEGDALAAILLGQLDEVKRLTVAAADLIEARKDKMSEQLKVNLARVLDGAPSADPDRVAQELAMIVVKTDVTEELDRLKAHIAAAKSLIDDGGGVGRKLDFLMQEFNREANTLCSKAQNNDLTTIGLDLKAVIDQMREQVQNVE